MRPLCSSRTLLVFTNESGKTTWGQSSKHVTSPCPPMQRNCIEPRGWRHVPEDGHKQRTVCPCLVPLFLQSEAHRAPRGPYRKVAGVVHEALTSKTWTRPLCLSVPEWTVGSNVLPSPVCHISLWWWWCCCWYTSAGNPPMQELYLQVLRLWLRTCFH